MTTNLVLKSNTNLLTHSFHGSGIWHILDGSSAQGLKRLKSRCWPAVFPYRRLTREKSPFNLLQVIGKNHLFEVIWLRSLFSCFLSARDSSQLLEATPRSSPCGPLHGPVHNMTICSFKARRRISLIFWISLTSGRAKFLF